MMQLITIHQPQNKDNESVTEPFFTYLCNSLSKIPLISMR